MELSRCLTYAGTAATGLLCAGLSEIIFLSQLLQPLPLHPRRLRIHNCGHPGFFTAQARTRGENRVRIPRDPFVPLVALRLTDMLIAFVLKLLDGFAQLVRASAFGKRPHDREQQEQPKCLRTPLVRYRLPAASSAMNCFQRLWRTMKLTSRASCVSTASTQAL